MDAPPQKRLRFTEFIQDRNKLVQQFVAVIGTTISEFLFQMIDTPHRDSVRAHKQETVQGANAEIGSTSCGSSPPYGADHYPKERSPCGEGAEADGARIHRLPLAEYSSSEAGSTTPAVFVAG